MCSAVFGSRIAIGRIEVTFVCHPFKISFEFEGLGCGPIDSRRVERVREIDNTARRQSERSLRHNGNGQDHEEKQVQTLHTECSFGLGFCYLHCKDRYLARSFGMQIGMIGLGRMGANMVRRLLRAGHECVVYDRSPDAVKALVSEGATGGASLNEFIQKLNAPRAIWLMIPAAVVDATLKDLEAVVDAGDI